MKVHITVNNSGGGGGAPVNSLDMYFTNDIDDVSENNVTYIGKETEEGLWLIMKIVTDSSGTTIRGASQKNNVAYDNYASAWEDRLSLTYDYLKEVL